MSSQGAITYVRRKLRRKSAAKDSGVQSATNVQEAPKIPAVAMGHAWMVYSVTEPASARSNTVVLPARIVEMKIVLAQTVSQCVTVCTGNATAASMGMEAALAMEVTLASGVIKSFPFAKA